MKSIYFTIAILFFAFTSCKNAEETNVENSIDTTSIQQDRIENIDTASYDAASTEQATDTTTESTSSEGKLNKMSTSTEVTYKDPSKGKYALAETKWRLIELNGNTIEPTTRRDYFMNFDSKSGTFKAFVGCNNISGNYFMKSEGKLGFTNVISTRKACNDKDVERNFFNNLQKTDNYMIEANGKVLHLHVGKKAVAKFEAIK
jgi:heat shock protein HslJ